MLPGPINALIVPNGSSAYTYTPVVPKPGVVDDSTLGIKLGVDRFNGSSTLFSLNQRWKPVFNHPSIVMKLKPKLEKNEYRYSKPKPKNVNTGILDYRNNKNRNRKIKMSVSRLCIFSFSIKAICTNFNNQNLFFWFYFYRTHTYVSGQRKLYGSIESPEFNGFEFGANKCSAPLHA